MNETRHFVTEGKGSVEHARWRNHLVRTATTAAIAVLLYIDGLACQGSARAHLPLIVLGLLYPQLSWALLRHRDQKGRVGRVLYLVDGYFCGAVCGELGLALLPATTLVSLCIFTWLLMGGLWLALLGSATFALGIDVNLTTLGGVSGASACTRLDIASAAVIVFYFSAVAYLIFREVQRLKIDRTKAEAEFSALRAARDRADRALSSLLPERLRDTANGRIPSSLTDVRDAVLLSVFLRRGVGGDLADLALGQRFHALHLIANRHGIEIAKTFGPFAIGIGTLHATVDNALDAALEFARHDRDHFRMASIECGAIVTVHFGDVRLGLTNPDRFDVELSGPALDEIHDLTIESATYQGGPPIRLTAAARQHLSTSRAVVQVKLNESDRLFFVPEGLTPD